MHKCLKCGRTAQSLSEISEGCTCGSKVFVFTRLSDGEPFAEPSHSITLIPNLGSRQSRPARACAPDAPEPVSSQSPDAAPPVSVEPASSSDAISEAILSSEPVEEEPALRSISPAVASAPIPQPEDDWLDSSKPYSEVWLSKGGSIKPQENGVPVQSVDSAAAMSESDVANVRQVRSGIYEIDVGRLKGEPLVIQDSEGVYYVRLPFVPLGEAAPGEMTKDRR